LAVSFQKKFLPTQYACACPSHGRHIEDEIFRVTTCLENLEMPGNLTRVREMSGILLQVREVSRKKCCQGKVA